METGKRHPTTIFVPNKGGGDEIDILLLFFIVAVVVVVVVVVVDSSHNRFLGGFIRVWFEFNTFF